VVESPEPYEEEGVDECVKELSVRTTQEKDEEEEDERLDLVLGKLVKITDMLDLVCKRLICSHEESNEMMKRTEANKANKHNIEERNILICRVQ